MLYANVYLVGQVYGGSEEGGWYYAAGEPLGSVPIKSIRVPGKAYYIGDGKVNVRECDGCHGKGEVDMEDEVYPERETYLIRCPNCRELPIDLEATAKVMEELEEMFREDAGRYEEIVVSLENHFAVPFPEQRPRYE